MPQERLSMRKLKEVLRLHSLGLKQQQIARSCSIAQSTVHEYLKAAAAAGVNWPLPADWDDRHLEETITGKSGPIEVWLYAVAGTARFARPIPAYTREWGVRVAARIEPDRPSSSSTP